MLVIVTTVFTAMVTYAAVRLTILTNLKLIRKRDDNIFVFKQMLMNVNNKVIMKVITATRIQNVSTPQDRTSVNAYPVIDGLTGSTAQSSTNAVQESMDVIYMRNV